MKYETTIGLEVHAQLRTRTKMFCRCENVFGREPNTLTCPVCLGLPGALPVLNRQAIALAIRMGLALHCEIRPRSVFARKNYFYPDLPKGYQISQFDRPLSEKGFLEIRSSNGPKRIGIERVHVEEDAGKLLHGDNLLTKEGSLVDLNRCGVPLVEIVGAPDLTTPQEAAEYLKKLRSIVRYTDVCDGNMEEGSFRCDANVSVKPEGSKSLGTKVEIKNMNSFKHVQKALEFEIQRQTEALERGEKIAQETRLWNPDEGGTSSMRSKEYAHDYRYFPEPDLLPLEFETAWIEEIKRSLPELPDDRRARFEETFRLPPYDAEVLTAEKETAEYFEEVLRNYGTQAPDKAKAISNTITSVALGIANERGERLDKSNMKPKYVADLQKLIDDGSISGKMAKEVLEELAQTGEEPSAIVKKKGLAQISDRGALEKVVRDVIAANPTQTQQYKAGKEKLFGFFVGQVMKATGGQANPVLLNEILKAELSRGV
ncbi:MAG: Asp-tRNA(Asn)/Glu-tRNA(Gln) amidotransferase subunit GatB [Pseudomonadota bacterium]